MALGPTSDARRSRGGREEPAVALGFQSVSFGYGHRAVLRDVSFTVEPGKHVAIVGATGSGKSTLLALASRAWDPPTGSVTLDGRSVRHLRLAHLRARTAVWPQHIHVFNWTLRDNTRLGKPQASDAEILRALDRARLGGFVRNLPGGLEALLGEFGARMSAGERQRLGFARLLLTDASLVLVDEPTAHLDVECEQAVLEELHAWARGRTMLLTSHRAAALMFADQVYELRAGRLTARWV